MREIQIDIDVHKTIEAGRQSFDETENDILRRLLSLDGSSEGRTSKDLHMRNSRLSRQRVLPDGLQLKKSYKGTTYSAEVVGGFIHCQESVYSTPSAAACDVTKTSVNGWTFWEYYDMTSKSWQQIDRLRKQTTPHVAEGELSTIAESALGKPRTGKSYSPEWRWVDYVAEALRNLGGSGTLDEIYDQVKRIHPGPLSKEWKATVRHTIECHSSASKNFNGIDMFYSVEGKHHGVWGIRAKRRQP